MKARATSVIAFSLMVAACNSEPSEPETARAETVPTARVRAPSTVIYSPHRRACPPVLQRKWLPPAGNRVPALPRRKETLKMAQSRRRAPVVRPTGSTEAGKGAIALAL